MAYSKTRSKLLRSILAALLCAATAACDEDKVVVYRGSRPGCSAVTVGTGQPVTFTGGAASIDGALATVYWSVDGEWLEEQSIPNRWSEDELRFVHSFSEAGSHEVAMYVFDDRGNGALERWTVQAVEDRSTYAPKACRVWPEPAAARVTAGVPETFTATVTDIDGDVHGVEWYRDGRFIDAKYREQVDGDPRLTIFSRRFTMHDVGRSVNLSAVPFDREGHYGNPISWTVEVEPRPRLVYVGFFDRILPSARERDKLVDFVRRHAITDVVLYRLHWLFPTSEADDCWSQDSKWNLMELILALREAGAERVHAAVSGDDYYLDHVKRFADFYDENAAGRPGYEEAPKGFDGVVTEKEFWNGDQSERAEKFQAYMHSLGELRSLIPPEMEISAYVARVSYVEAEAIAAVVDRVLLMSYADSPADAYGEAADYLPRFRVSRARPTEIWPILSGENETDKRSFCKVTSDHEPFMGDWMNYAARWGDPIPRAEEGFLRPWKQEEEAWKYGVRISGFAWYDYNVLEDDLRSTDSNVAPRVCHLYGGKPDPYVALAPAARVCGVQTVDLAVGESYTFRVAAWDHDGNLTGTLWSGWEDENVHYDAAGSQDRQYVSGTDVGSGDYAEFARRYRFSAAGEYEIRAFTLDRQEAFGQDLLWRVRVE